MPKLTRDDFTDEGSRRPATDRVVPPVGCFTERALAVREAEQGHVYRSEKHPQSVR